MSARKNTFLHITTVLQSVIMHNSLKTWARFFCTQSLLQRFEKPFNVHILTTVFGASAGWFLTNKKSLGCPTPGVKLCKIICFLSVSLHVTVCLHAQG